MLDRLLARVTRLPVEVPHDNEPIRMGYIYVAGPDRHMLLRPGRILMRGGGHTRTAPARRSTRCSARRRWPMARG